MGFWNVSDKRRRAVQEKRADLERRLDAEIQHRFSERMTLRIRLVIDVRQNDESASCVWLRVFSRSPALPTKIFRERKVGGVDVNAALDYAKQVVDAALATEAAAQKDAAHVKALGQAARELGDRYGDHALYVEYGRFTYRRQFVTLSDAEEFMRRLSAR